MPKFTKPKPLPPVAPEVTEAADAADRTRQKYLAALRSVLLPGCGPTATRTVKAILQARGVKHALTTAQAAEIEQLQAKFEEATAGFDKCGHTAAQHQYKDQLSGIGLDEGARLKSSIRFEHKLKRHAIKEELKGIRARASEICQSGWELVAREAGEFAKAREAQEQAEAKDWSVDFVPSTLLLTAQRIAAEGPQIAVTLSALSPAKQAAELALV